MQRWSFTAPWASSNGDWGLQEGEENGHFCSIKLDIHARAAWFTAASLVGAHKSDLTKPTGAGFHLSVLSNVQLVVLLTVQCTETMKLNILKLWSELELSYFFLAVQCIVSCFFKILNFSCTFHYFHHLNVFLLWKLHDPIKMHY
jgi:hypothetical protein